MKRLLPLLAILIFSAAAASAQSIDRASGWCENGGKIVQLGGLTSTTKVQASYPSCTVAVYLHGTLTLATLYANRSLTPLANPFTANTDGSYGFYLEDAIHFDITMSGGTAPNVFPVPFTISDLVLGGGGGGGGGTVFSVSCDNLPPLFTCTTATPATTPELQFTLSDAAANTVYGNSTNSTAAPAFTKLFTAQAGTHVQGNGLLFQLSTGVVINGNCAQFDAAGNVIDAGAPCSSGGSGISGLTAGAVVTGLTSTSVQTPDPTATLDAGGNFLTDGSVGTGLGGTTAGILNIAQGTAQTVVTNYFGLTAPTSVTAYNLTVPGVEPTADNLLVVTSITTHIALSSWKAIANCTDTAGNHLNYSTSTHAFSCGTSSSTPAQVYPGAGVPVSTGSAWSTSLSTAGVIRRTCAIIVGADDAAAVLSNSNLGPQGRLCFIPAGATILEVDVAGDAGTPNVIVGRNRAGSIVNITSAALATAASGGIACSNTGGTTGIDGATTCSSTLQNTTLNAGDYLQLVSGTAGGTAKRMSIFITWAIS